jgi:predicted outer membrane protein
VVGPVISRAVRKAAVLVVLGIGVLMPLSGCSIGTSQAAATPPGQVDPNNPLDVGTQVTQSQWGPVGPGDRLMLVKVALAGSWELPSGEMAQTMTNNPAVRTAGQHLIQGHTMLNKMNVDIAAKLGVTLPTKPLPEQQGFLTNMQNAQPGIDFDRAFVGPLRDQHGAVYQLLSAVRTGTRNSLIRDFANVCMSTVLDHITVLEKTGLVNYSALPSPTAPPVTPVTTAAQVTSNNQSSIGVFVIAALMAGIAILVPVLRRNSRVGKRSAGAVVPER